MVWFTRPSRPGARRPSSFRLAVELLETRELPAVTTWPGLQNPVPDQAAVDSLGAATPLGILSGSSPGEAVGTVGDGNAGAADVDWYSFDLAETASVKIETLARAGGSSLQSVLSLYNTDPVDFFDRSFSTLSGYRRLAQADGSLQGGDAEIDITLAAGTYYVAVSGGGNDSFHPLLPDSGTFGSTGNYGLRISVTEPPVDPAGGPVVLRADPAGAVSSSPLLLRLAFNTDMLDPFTILLENTAPEGAFDPRTVQLRYNPDAPPTEGNETAIQLQSAHFSPTARELQLRPATALAPGYYRLSLFGDSSRHDFMIADLAGNPLGKDAGHATGQDYELTFRVDNVEANEDHPGQNDDSPDTAHDLGDVRSAGLIQRRGAIGDNPDLTVPANDVDYYHFRLSGPGLWAVVAEVFAGRIDSRLNPQLQLFRKDPDGLKLLAANNDTMNPSVTTDGLLVPLFTDSALTVGLPAGEYYLAVSTGVVLPYFPPGYVPSPFDIPPESQGEYVLNLLAQPATATAVHVLSTTPAEGAVLGSPPTMLEVRFDRPINDLLLAHRTAQQSPDQELNVAFIRGIDRDYYPRFVSFDPETNVARFLMLDALPNGDYELHLSGPGGIVDQEGNTLAGNTETGEEYVVHFSVDGPPRGAEGDPTSWVGGTTDDSAAAPQVLGPLFPHEMDEFRQVTITRNFLGNPGAAPGDTADYFQITLLQNQIYTFSLEPVFEDGAVLPDGIPILFDASGNQLTPVIDEFTGVPSFTLDAGTYLVRIGGEAGWAPEQATSIAYVLRIAISGIDENPTPLTTGPAPVFRIRLATAPPSSGTEPPRVTTPTASQVPVPAVFVPVSGKSATRESPTVGGNSLSVALLLTAFSPVGGVSAGQQSPGSGPDAGRPVVTVPGRASSVLVVVASLVQPSGSAELTAEDGALLAGGTEFTVAVRDVGAFVSRLLRLLQKFLAAPASNQPSSAPATPVPGENVETMKGEAETPPVEAEPVADGLLPPASEQSPAAMQSALLLIGALALGLLCETRRPGDKEKRRKGEKPTAPSSLLVSRSPGLLVSLFPPARRLPNAAGIYPPASR